MLREPLLTAHQLREWITHLRAVVRGQQVLLHGTSRGSLVARTDTLLHSHLGTVSFTRSVVVATHFACLPTDNHDGLPTVFVFDRDHLNSRYALHPDNEGGITFRDEQEERIWGRDLRHVSRYLLAASFFVDHAVTYSKDDFIGFRLDLVEEVAMRRDRRRVPEYP